MGNEGSTDRSSKIAEAFAECLEGMEAPQQEEPAADDASKARASMLREILKREDLTSAAIPLEMLLPMYHKQFGINTQDAALPLLHAAIRNDKLRCAKTMLAHPEIDVAVRTSKNESVLLLALRYASDELCELLLAMPAVCAAVLSATEDKVECMFAAAQRSSASVLMRMLAMEDGRMLDPAASGPKGCSLFVPLLLNSDFDDSHKQALDWLLARNDMRALLNIPAYLTPLVAACGRGRLQYVEALLEAGAAPGAPCTDGETPLMRCSVYEDEDQGLVCATRLLQHDDARTFVNAMWKDRTALALACHKGHACMVRLLLQHGASALTQCEHGTTPLVAAIRSHNSEEIVPLLLVREDVQRQLRAQSVAEPTHPIYAAMECDNRAALDALLPFVSPQPSAVTTETDAS